MVFALLLAKLAPLYIIIAFGFIAARKLQVQRESVARLLMYIIAPTVVFSAAATTPLSAGVLMMPVVLFVISSAFCLIAWQIAKRVWSDASANILAFASGTANTGYFGLPVAIALYGTDIAGYVLIATLGSIVYENTIGFYVTARGHHTPKESIIRLLKLPTMYAFAFGILLNVTGVELAQTIIDATQLFRGAYSVLGMMLIGIGLGAISGYEFDTKFVLATWITKFVWWPATMLLVVWLDSKYWNIFTSDMHNILLLLSVTPLAANTVAFATELKAHPEKAAVAVFISTLLSLIAIPLMTSL